jgi:hypothetical protein
MLAVLGVVLAAEQQQAQLAHRGLIPPEGALLARLQEEMEGTLRMAFNPRVFLAICANS